MKKLAIIGNPVAHSLSPIMHNSVFKHLGMNYEYTQIELSRRQLKGFTDLARDEYLGFNVTVPYKTEIIKYLDFVSSNAAFAKSVNTILVKDKKLYGYSTDGHGFERAITESFHVDATSEIFFFIGCGGASRAVIAHLLSMGTKKIVIVNRTVSKVEEFIAVLVRKYPKVEIISCASDSKEIVRYLDDFPIIVQATSLGLKNNDALPFNLKILKKGMRVFDMIYRNTPFLEEARKQGCTVGNGLLMLLYQGAKAFEIWTGERSPIEIMKESLVYSQTKSKN